MTSANPEDRSLQERAQVTHWEPPMHDLTDPIWTAEDPVTECIGMGTVEEEAYGNLVAVVAAYEDDGGHGEGYTRIPGRTIKRRLDGSGGGLLDRVRDLF